MLVCKHPWWCGQTYQTRLKKAGRITKVTSGTEVHKFGNCWRREYLGWRKEYQSSSTWLEFFAYAQANKFGVLQYLAEITAVLGWDYCSTWVRLLQYLDESTGRRQSKLIMRFVV